VLLLQETKQMNHLFETQYWSTDLLIAHFILHKTGPNKHISK